MKKIISITLAAVLLVCAFSACSKSEKATPFSLKYTYDSAYSSFDDSTVRAYETLCEAVTKGESEIRINVGFIYDVQQLFYTSFPLSVLVEDIKENEDGSVGITYKNEKEAHLKAVSDFEAKINAILTECKADNKNVFAVNVYSYVSSHVKESSDDAITCYDTVMKGEGTSFSYSQLFEYLLQQGGIKAYHILANDAANKSWGLSAAEVLGEVYYFDVMTEFYTTKGEGLRCFGMTSDDLKAEGLKGTKYSNQNAAFDVSSLTFDACRICKSYYIQDNSLFISTTDDNLVQIAL